MSKSICSSQCLIFRGNRVQVALWVLKVADPWFRSRGEGTQPWRERVEVKVTSEKMLLTSTHNNLLVRKPVILGISWLSKGKRVEGFHTRMFGCNALNAEEKSGNKSLLWRWDVPGAFVRCQRWMFRFWSRCISVFWSLDSFSTF